MSETSGKLQASDLPTSQSTYHIAMILVAATLVAAAAALAPPAKVDVAIAGGGLGGLAACAALRARGVDAHVFEAAGELLRGSTGTGIMISANGMAALGAVDRRLPAAMRARGVRITAQHITKYAADGEVELRRTSDATTFRDAFGHDQYNIAWSAAHAALAAVVPRENVHCGRAVAGATAADGGVDVAFADGSSVRCGLLVGADGIGSRVRELVAPGADAPRYSGQLLWNAIVDSEALPLHGPGEVSFATTGLDGRAILAFDAGGGKTSWYLTLPLDAAPRSAAAIAAGSFGGFGGDGLDDLKASFGIPRRARVPRGDAARGRLRAAPRRPAAPEVVDGAGRARRAPGRRGAPDGAVAGPGDDGHVGGRGRPRRARRDPLRARGDEGLRAAAAGAVRHGAEVLRGGVHGPAVAGAEPAQVPPTAGQLPPDQADVRRLRAPRRAARGAVREVGLERARV